MDMFRDRIAIVTGGASGIGRTLCEHLGKRGAHVVVADIDAMGAMEVAEAVSGAGGRAWSAPLDVTRSEDVRALIEATAERHGRLDYMFNNAGIDIGGQTQDLLPEHWHRVFDINLMGVVYGTTAAYSLMVRQESGHIVNTASLCGIIPVPIQVPYAATKHAVVGLSTSLRSEGADLGVKVSVFCPGVVRTPLLEKSQVINSSMDEIMQMSPLKIMDVKDAVHVLLRGVERNRAIIVCPFQSKVSWWLYRLSPALMDNLIQRGLKKFRQDHSFGS